MPSPVHEPHGERQYGQAGEAALPAVVFWPRSILIPSIRAAWGGHEGSLFLIPAGLEESLLQRVEASPFLTVSSTQIHVQQILIEAWTAVPSEAAMPAAQQALSTEPVHARTGFVTIPCRRGKACVSGCDALLSSMAFHLRLA